MTQPRSEYHAQFAMSLQALRTRAGLSQNHVADRAGIATRSLADYESGDKAPGTRDRLVAIYDAIEATPPEREALDTIWSMIGANSATNKAKPKRTGRSETPFPPALDDELRALQDVITALRASRHAKAPYLICAVLNAVERITTEAKEASYGY